jgi:AcrR family transcriptional regulator
MPSETYYRLPGPKRKRIFDGAVKLILNHPIEELTISHVVRQTGIPRGSFYQYFDSLEDILKYVYVTFIETFEAFKLDQVKGKKRSLMEYFETSFEADHHFFTTCQFHDVYAKLMQARKFVGLDLAVHEKTRMAFIKLLLSELDTSSFSHLSEEEIIWIYMLYVRVKNQELQRIISGTITKEEGFRMFRFYLDLMLRGAHHA